MDTSPIDLRSDTVTRPTAAMRAAMAEAPVGDDTYGEDPTVNRLQARLAEMLGKEAALFVPSGTMSNQIAIRVHCRPGDEFICEAQCHIHNYEQGGAAQLSGVSTRAVEGDFGLIDVSQIAGLVRKDNIHYAITRLICLENTHNRGGGRILPLDNVVDICRFAHQQGLAAHLDGARLFNAVVATGIDAARWAEPFDTVSICFSKGLGAPVGSALAGTHEHIAAALRHRKAFGGAMRQAGILAAGALYALDNHVERLAVDHEHARLLADGIRSVAGVTVRPERIDTNMVMLHIDKELCTAAEFSARLRQRGVLINPFGGQSLRAVTHLDISRADVELTVKAIVEAARGAPASPSTPPSRNKTAYA